jgi:hypothetical protein
MYFNKKYKRVGPVFQQRYRAVRIINDAQTHACFQDIFILTQTTTMIMSGQACLIIYLQSELIGYLPEEFWICSIKQLTTKKFVDDYKEYRDDLEDLKHYLADNI